MSFRKLFLVAVVAWILLGSVACKTVEDDENMSARPWNRPRYWEHGGLPSSVYEDR